MENILNTLNSEQQAAVKQTKGPAIVLAGAGSGKTRVLVHRVLYLISEKNVDPSHILMVTFTNKAAGEMMERIKQALSHTPLSHTPTIGTFHSLCARILRKEGHHINLSHAYKIYDTADQLETVKDALVQTDISIKQVKPRSILSVISHAKNQMIDPLTYSSFARGYFAETVAKVYPVYQSLLKERDAVDFDDLLLEAIRLFHASPQVLEKYQQQFWYIMVDEYQDTNPAQYMLTKLLGAARRNICVVGDFSQSIYSFRGADFRNLQKFKKDFPEAITFPLSQNYRSTQKILDASHAVISHNTTHPVLSLWTENSGGEEIKLFQAEDEHSEIKRIINIIQEERLKNPSFSYRDAAILYRTNAQSRTIEEVFLHEGIPYVLVGGVRFYERREIKDVLAMASYLANQKDTVSLNRIEKIGKKRLKDFLEYVEEFNTGHYQEEKSTLEILDEVVKKTSYLALFDENDPEDRARLENIKELRSVALEFTNLISFLENVSLVEQEYLPDHVIKEARPNAITLMTLHAAKGLEFKIVFLVGMEEGLFPHSQSLLDASELEEERRLCYVGITRAKERLYISFARRRLIFGQRVSPTVSRFVMELPEEVLRKNMVELYDEEPDYL